MIPESAPRLRPPDIGKRAGVIAGILGAMAVMGEFCFLFPDYLVYHDTMPFYRAHIDLIRGLLQATIGASLVLGTTSAVMIRSKVYGLIGIALGSIALLLGGSKAEAITTKPRAISTGLDYFLLELLVLGLVFVPMERLWTLRDQKIFRTGWQTDLKHFFASHAGVQIISFLTIIPVQVLFA